MFFLDFFEFLHKSPKPPLRYASYRYNCILEVRVFRHYRNELKNMGTDDVLGTTMEKY